MRHISLGVGLGLGLGLAVACSGDDGSDGTGGASSGSSGTSSGGASGGTPHPPGGSSGTGSSGGADGYAPEYGRFGVPESSFTLPTPAPTNDGIPPGLYYPHLQQAFPEVDWSTLDRLYLPAGEYRSVCLGDLPERSADRPLVVTNKGGQVKVGGYAQGYVMSIGCGGGKGGSNWILTGRYDPTSQTGDAGFRGHAEGSFAHSQGSYGIFIDDAFSKEGLSGMAVGGRATDFEIEVLEVTRAEFAGVVAKTDSDGTATMRNVKFHDMYIHDVGSEGIYFGSTQAQPQHTFENLKIYDNRMLRTGTEALQVGQLGDGCEVHHNVLGPAAIRWRSAFQTYQDGNIQYGQRHGSSSFHHNVVIGAGDLLLEFFPTHVDTDERGASDTVVFADNYFADTSAGGAATHATANDVTVRVERNSFTGFHFNYDEVYPSADPPVGVLHPGAGSPNPHVIEDNTFEGPERFVTYPQPNVTESNNVAAPVPRVKFRAFMDEVIEGNARRLEWWTDKATLASGSPAVTYPVGMRVMHRGDVYEALVENAGKPPHEHPETWSKQEAPADDVRLSAESPHQGLGLRWPPE